MEDSTLNLRTDWIVNLGGGEGGRKRRTEEEKEDEEGMHLCPSRDEQVAFATVCLEKDSPLGRRRTGSRRRRKPIVRRRPRSNHYWEVGAHHRHRTVFFKASEMSQQCSRPVRAFFDFDIPWMGFSSLVSGQWASLLWYYNSSLINCMAPAHFFPESSCVKELF
jgi:hypothetical protein